MEKTIIFHHDDMDGRSAAYLVMKYAKLEKYNTKLIEVNFSDRSIIHFINEVDFDTIVYIVDYSFTEATFNSLKSIIINAKKVIWIDHHESSVKLINHHISEFNGYVDDSILDYYVTEKEGSGAVLVLKYFKEYIIPALWIKYVSDWDTWNYNSTKEYKNAVLAFKYGMEGCNQDPIDGVWKDLDGENKLTVLDAIMNKGSNIREYVEASNLDYLKKFGFIAHFPNDNYTCLCLNSQSSSLVFGDYIYDFDMVIGFSYNGDTYSYSIYTEREDLNVRTIAELHRGGGHPKAAGFTSNIMLLKRTMSFKDWLNISDIRTHCPKIHYKFSGSDSTKYSEEAE